MLLGSSGVVRCQAFPAMLGLGVTCRRSIPPQVRALADGATLAAERVAAPWTTLANMSRAPPVCLVTDGGGVGTLLYRHDGRDQRYRLGPFGWYLESAEFESGEIWDRGVGGAWVLKRAYGAREAERRCYADFGIEVAPARTDAFYTFLHSQVPVASRASATAAHTSEYTISETGCSEKAPKWRIVSTIV